MSGGFFRGTSADQDTRFSNKQAKLLKSQKFAPELENLVDMTKVKLDLMKPWIAKRVTDLIGFEDEVLINFIYGLLEGKAVNGKQLQISITGFMERNTGRFMKELWGLLLSAQQNVSGVPQQFLDAKEEETKNKLDADRLANEIRRNKEKEKQELDQEKIKMEGDGETLRVKHTMFEHDPIQPTYGKYQHKRNSLSESNRGLTSDSAHRSSSTRDRRRSRSISISPRLRSRSISSERWHSLQRRSLTPRQGDTIWRSPSPLRQRSSHSKRGSMSCTQHRSPSPARQRVLSPRSPLRRRSRSPSQRRLRTSTRRSPARYRSRSPLHRRSPSPVRRRSPSPKHHNSPSPLRRRSPSPLRRNPQYLRHQSPSPVRRRYRRSPSTPRQRSISPNKNSFFKHQGKSSLTTNVQRYLSPQESSSPSPLHRNSLSPMRRGSPRKGGRSALPSPVQSISDRKADYKENREQVLSTIHETTAFREKEIEPLSNETVEHITEVQENRKNKKLDKKELDPHDYSIYDSSDEKREAKRIRKEEKKLEKEKRRQRREDRRKRKEGRRAEKLKLKQGDDTGSSSSDVELDQSEDESVQRQDILTGDIQKIQSEQKKLEIELREKALESLRAKKRISN